MQRSPITARSVVLKVEARPCKLSAQKLDPILSVNPWMSIFPVHVQTMLTCQSLTRCAYRVLLYLT